MTLRSRLESLARRYRRLRGRPEPVPARPRFPIGVLPPPTRVPAIDEDWLYVPAADARYDAMLAAEAEFWEAGDPFNECVASQPRWQRRYFGFVNRAFTGAAELPWWIWVA